jgi:RNA-directed DNA polymerase
VLPTVRLVFYYAVPTTFRALNTFYYHVLWHWLRCLRRRSQRHGLTWRKMTRIAERWLPSPKLRHPYPDWRFDVMTRGGEPGALGAHTGICAGAASLPQQLI